MVVERSVLALAVVFVLVGVCGIFLGGCAQSGGRSLPAADQKKKIRVVATIYPLAEFTRQIGGTRVEAAQLLPVGADPHHWEPSPRDLVMLNQAQLLIFNGAGLEPWLDRLLPSLRLKGIQVVEATRDLDLMTFSEEEELGITYCIGGSPLDASRRREDRDNKSEKQGQNRAALDPHVWLDPLMAREIVGHLSDQLKIVDPANSAYYERRAQVFEEKLDHLHQEYVAAAKTFRSRDLVVSHGAFGYLARRYGLRQVPLLGLMPEQEPDAATLKEIVEFCRRGGVKCVFFEPLVSPRLSEVLAWEIGAQTLMLNPIGGLTKEEERSGVGYLHLMSQNLASLKRGLG